MNHPESTLQQSIVKYFRHQYPDYRKLFFAVPNGGRRNAKEAARLKGEGVVPGVSDLLLLVPKGIHHGFCFELKAGKNQLTEDQKKFGECVTKQGYRFEVIRTFDEFKNVIEGYLKTK